LASAGDWFIFHPNFGLVYFLTFWPVISSQRKHQASLIQQELHIFRLGLSVGEQPAFD